MHVGGRWHRGLTSACALTLVGAGVSSAQQGWGTAPDLLSGISSTGGAIYAPLVEVDAAGNAIALWSEPGLSGFFGIGQIVWTARRSVATGSWSTPVRLSPGGVRTSLATDLSIDAAGNALAVWDSNPVSTAQYVRAARYSVQTGQWTDVAIGWLDFSLYSQGSMNAAGDALVCAIEYIGTSRLLCQRYVAATSTWSVLPVLSSASASLLDVEVDGTGNAAVVWLTSSRTAVQAARFNAATSTWGPVADLATGLPLTSVPGPQLAMNEAGDAVATWTRGTALEASRLPAGASAWTAPVTLSSDLSFTNEAARPVVAPSGDITVAWVQTGPSVRATVARFIAASRYDVASATWTPMALPNQTGFPYGPPAIDADALGNVHVVWSRSLASPGIRLTASRYAVATGQWTTVSDLSAQDQAAYNPDIATDDRGNAIAIWFQTAGGFSVPESLRWAATPGAVALTSLTPAAGTVSAGVMLPSGADPGLAPTTFEYSLDGGTSWTTRSPGGVSSPIVVTGLTDGVTYALAVRAVNAAGPGPASAPLQVRSGAGTTPTNFRLAARAGNRLTFAWVAPSAGFVPTAYEIEGGIGGQVLATLPTGGAATQFGVSAPDGTFFVRVVATAGGLRSAPSNEIVVTVGGTSTPTPPESLLASKSGPTIVLSWTSVLDQGEPSSTRVVVNGPPSTLSAVVPAGEWTSFPAFPGRSVYDVTVAATNANGTSAPSNAVVVPASATCSGAPSPPRAFSASTQGGVAYLDWLPPSTGEAVTSYVVTVTGAYTGSFPVAARTLAAAVPAGTYTVQVTSFGPCGTSVPTAPQTIAVR